MKSIFKKLIILVCSCLMVFAASTVAFAANSDYDPYRLTLFGQPLQESDNAIGTKQYTAILNGNIRVVKAEDFGFVEPNRDKTFEQLVGQAAFTKLNGRGKKIEPQELRGLNKLVYPVGDPRHDISDTVFSNSVWNTCKVLGYTYKETADTETMAGVLIAKLPDNMTVESLPEDMRKYVINVPDDENIKNRVTWNWVQDEIGWRVIYEDGEVVKDPVFYESADGYYYWLNTETGYMRTNEMVTMQDPFDYDNNTWVDENGHPYVPNQLKREASGKWGNISVFDMIYSDTAE